MIAKKLVIIDSSRHLGKGMNRITIQIDSLAYGGSGVGRVDNIVYFVPLAAPQELLEIEVVKEEKRYRVGRITGIIEPSPHRVKPECPYFGECGGCNWQHITYERQLEEKRKILEDAITRIGKTAPSIDPVIPSPDIYGYRKRTRLKFTADGKIGYFAAESHRLVEIDSCPILSPEINSFLPRLKSEPALQTPSPGETLSPGEVEIYVDPEGSVQCSFVSSSKKAALPFSQVNQRVDSLLKEKIYSLVTEFCRKDKPPVIMDLYCGDGNLSLNLSGIAGSITGWDQSAAAIRRARQAVRKLGLQNVVYKRSDVGGALAEIARSGRAVDILIADPPRKGLKGIIPAIVSLEAPFIFYVSCVPPILARDLGALIKAGYVIKQVIPFDMFPQTFHLETMVVLGR